MVPELSLSAETLTALKSFALSNGIECSDDDIIKTVASHFDIRDRNDLFTYKWCKNELEVEITLKGVKRELGQTLSSTGLTMYVAFAVTFKHCP